MRVIHVLRKPLSEGTVASNTLKHGVGGLNIDASRVGAEQVFTHSRGSNRAFPKRPGETSVEESGRKERQDILDHTPRTGRWPANLILQHLDGCRRTGTRAVKGYQINRFTDGAKHFGGAAGHAYEGTTMEGGVEAVWACASGCRVRALDEQSGISKSTGGRIGNKDGAYGELGRVGFTKKHEKGDPGFGDVGGASRFYKQVGGRDE
jgi:hypothetical protein